MAKYTLFNRQFYLSTEPFLTPDLFASRLFQVEIKMANTKLLFWEDYQELLLIYFRMFGVKLPNHAGLISDLERQIQRTYVKNKLYKGVLVQITFFQIEGELIYMLELREPMQEIYSLAHREIELIENKRLFKMSNLLSVLAIGCEDVWRMSSKLCNVNADQLPLIMDEKERVLEVPFANLFLLIDEKTVLTPKSGFGVCVNPARQLGIAVLQDLGYDLRESDVFISDLLRATEVCVLNDLKGVRLVTSFKQVRYYRTFGQRFSEAFEAALRV